MQNVITVIFKVESEAYQAFSELKGDPSSSSHQILQMSLVKKENGKLVPKESYDSGVNTTDDTARGGLIGALIGIWTGPIGLLLGASWGALIGHSVDAGEAKEAITLIDYVGNSLEEGGSAIIILAEEEGTGWSYDRLYKFETTIDRRDAGDVRKEIEKAKALQKDLEKQTKKAMREKKKEERKAKIKSKFSKEK